MSKIPEQIKKLPCVATSWYIFLRIKAISPAFTEVYVCNCAHNSFPVVVILSQIIPIHILPHFFRKYFNTILAFMPIFYASPHDNKCRFYHLSLGNLITVLRNTSYGIAPFSVLF